MISSKAYRSLGLLRRVCKDSHCAQAHKSLHVTPNYCTVLHSGGHTYYGTLNYLKKYNGESPNLCCLIIIQTTNPDWSTTINVHLWNCCPNYVNFTTTTTRSVGTKLYLKTAHINPIMNSYFYCLPRFWNSLPIIDLSQSLEVIKVKLKKFLWNHFLANFDNSSCKFHYLFPRPHCSKTPTPTNYNYL